MAYIQTHKNRVKLIFPPEIIFKTFRGKLYSLNVEIVNDSIFYNNKKILCKEVKEYFHVLNKSK